VDEGAPPGGLTVAALTLTDIVVINLDVVKNNVGDNIPIHRRVELSDHGGTKLFLGMVSQ
jgi:hypothetical protein